MSHLPPVTWNEVATKDDLRASEAALRKDLASLATELRTEMHVGFTDMRSEFFEATNRQIKWLVTFAAAWTSLLATVVRFMP